VSWPIRRLGSEVQILLKKHNYWFKRILLKFGVSNPRFPEPETHFFGYFLLPATCFFFNHQTWIF